MVWGEAEPFLDFLKVYLSNVWLVTTHLRNLAKVLVWERMKWHYSGSTKSLVFECLVYRRYFHIIYLKSTNSYKQEIVSGSFFGLVVLLQTEWEPLMTLTQGSWLTSNRHLSMSPCSQTIKNKVCIIPGWSYSLLLPTSNAWK